MKKAFVIITAVLTLSNCTKTCPTFYTGKKCNTEIRTKYYGTYIGTYSTVSGTTSATATVSSHFLGVDYFYIDNSIRCQLTDNNRFTIPQQPQNIGGQLVSVGPGSGLFANGEIIFSFNTPTGTFSFVGNR